MRICSLLPGATEIAYALGLGDQIVGVTHECDYPHEAKQKRVVVRSGIDSTRMSGLEIDRKVGELLQTGKGLYTIDEQALIDSSPDVILTQGLCDVCALDYNEVVKAARLLPHAPIIVSLNPHTLTDVVDDISRVGAATNREAAADALMSDLRTRIERVGFREPDYRPRVVCLEWFEPLYVAGHWVPEMVALACGFDVRRTVKESTPLRHLEGWNDLPAVKADNVYALNGSAYFSRPGPRLVNGLEILAHLIHPQQITVSSSPAAPAESVLTSAVASQSMV